MASIPNFQVWITLLRVLLDAASVLAGGLFGVLLAGGAAALLHPAGGLWEILAISSCIGCVFCSLFGLYQPRRSFLDIVEQRQLLRAGLVSAGATRFILFLMHVPVSAGLFAWIWTGAILGLHFGRRAFRALADRLCRLGIGEVAAVVYGGGETGLRLARHLLRSPEMGVVPVGFIDDRPDLRGGTLEGLPVLGDFFALDPLLAKGRVRRVFIALPRVPRRTVLDILDVCRRHGATFHLVPSMPEQFLPVAQLRELEGIPLLGPPPLGRSRLEAVRRRTMDLLALPILSLSAVAIGCLVVARRAGRRETLLVRSHRIGLRGRLILVRKFRTEWSDGGSTVLDRFLARSGLDWLPLVWNLLRGEITLVGPRPMTPRETASLEERHLFRLEMVPGLTGLWRIAAAEDERLDELESDLQYLRGRSLLLDVAILLRTIDLPWNGFRGA